MLVISDLLCGGYFANLPPSVV